MRSMVLHFALAGVLLLPACASRHGSLEPGSPAPDEPVVLSVANHMWTDADVFVVVSSVTRRIGSVISQETVELPVPSDVVAVGTMQIRIDPLGGGTPYLTDPIEILAGQRVKLTVEHQTGLSTWVIERTSRW